MSTALATTGADAWVDSAKPNTNTGSGKWLRVKTGAEFAYLLVKNPVPKGGKVLSATLRLFEAGVFGASVQVDVQLISAKWAESQITWTNRPGVTGSTVSVTATGSADGQAWEFDVEALLQSIADSGNAFYGFRISTTNGTERKFYSFNASDNRPELDVEWSDAPDAPTELSPAQNAAVSVAKPVLSFNYHDVSGSTALDAVNVQVDPAGDFATPDFDSGWVDSDVPELDLSTTAYAGLADGDQTFWRVRVRDAAGIESDWAQARVFQRVARGTLTIDNPADVPDNFVEDSTPEISWTLTDATQNAWQVIVVDDANPSVQLLNTGRRAGTTDAYGVPKGIITSETATYRLTVRVWDTATRVQTPGDPIKTEVVRLFTYQDSAVPTPVSALAAAPDASGKPQIAVTWTRATAPDAFSIWRNSRIIATDLDPSDLFVSGTSYAYLDSSAPPYKTHTYKVKAKVGGVLSTSPTDTAVLEAPGIWLIDEDTNRIVPILFADQPAYDMPEVAGVLRTVNGNKAIRVYQGKSGLEGSVAGWIQDLAGGTAAAYGDDLLWMAVRPERTRRLILGGLNLHVVIGDMVVGPRVGGVGPDDRVVSFNFWSQDGVTT